MSSPPFVCIHSVSPEEEEAMIDKKIRAKENFSKKKNDDSKKNQNLEAEKAKVEVEMNAVVENET